MKKTIGLLTILVIVGVGFIYFLKNDLVNGVTFSSSIETPKMAKEQVKVNGKIKSQTVLLKNLETDEILLEKNSDKKVAIASLTKLMTVYVLLNSGKELNETVTISQKTLDELVKEGASLSGFLAGDTLTIKDIAYGIVLPSGGDASITAANYVSGSEDKFVDLMNQTAKKMGMTQTHFKNATGLDERNHYSTAEDLMRFMDVALKDATFTEILTTVRYQTEEKAYAPEGYYLESTMLKDSPDLSLQNGKIIGGKTGYTEKAGQCLISLAEVNGSRYLLITTGADGGPMTEQFNVSDARQIYQSI